MVMMMEFNLHGLELYEAREEIVYRLEECQMKGIREITLIHGFHRGQVLKNYIQSERFLKEMAKAGFKLMKKDNKNSGASSFIIIE